MRWILFLPVASFFALAPLAGGEKKASETPRTLVKVDPRFDKLIASGAKVETLAGGFKWTEGTVWVKNGGYLLFSDIPNNVINKWKEGEGASKFIHPAGYTGPRPRPGLDKKDEPGTNGLRIDAQGRLVSCEHGDRRVARMDVVLDANTKPMLSVDAIKKTTLADKWQGKRHNSPNDLVFARNGDLYYTDPPYGLEKHYDDPARELDFCGVYRLSKDGKQELLTKEMTRPNGIALSPDEKTLYVANSDPAQAIWKAFPIQADGSLGKGKVLFDATPWVKAGKPGLPDGLKVDVEGNLWATGPGGVHLFTPDGKLVGSIDTGVPTANVAFGGSDGSWLYIAANHDICRIKTLTRGIEWK